MKRLWSKNLLPLCAAFLLCGCIGRLWPYGEDTNYRITGMPDNAELTARLASILNDNLQDELEEGDEPEIYARRESYREHVIEAELLKGLYAQGYYGGAVEFVDDAEPLSGDYRIQPGARYTISSISVEPSVFSEFLSVNIAEGEPLDAEAVLAAQEALRDAVQKGRCWFTLDVRNAVVLDHDNHTGALTLHIDAGPEANFGPVIFTGQTSVETSYLNKLVPWKKGECFSRRKIGNLRTALLETGLFVRAEAILPEAPAADGTVAVAIRLDERAHRTIRAGLSYYTDEGLGAIAGWEHRNVFGEAETLDAELNLSTLKQSFDVDLTKPFFLRKDQDLSLGGSVRRQDTDAFQETAVDLEAHISRAFSKRLAGSSGVALTLSEITELNQINDDRSVYGLLSLPNSLTYDSRDNSLDPRRGWLLSGAVSPYFDMLGEAKPFVKTQFGASTYLALDSAEKHVLALKAGVGSILGRGESFDVPPTERFYAGGGGSVRGFGYQEVGPKDPEGEPLGGRSLLTGSTEFRSKFTDTIGGVAFVDAGTVSRESYFDISEDIAVGAGVGVRYFTGFGPVRFDVAVPLTHKEDLEQNYQFYISIGQAF